MDGSKDDNSVEWAVVSSNLGDHSVSMVEVTAIREALVLIHGCHTKILILTDLFELFSATILPVLSTHCSRVCISQLPQPSVRARLLYLCGSLATSLLVITSRLIPMLTWWPTSHVQVHVLCLQPMHSWWPIRPSVAHGGTRDWKQPPTSSAYWRTPSCPGCYVIGHGRKRLSPSDYATCHLPSRVQLAMSHAQVRCCAWWHDVNKDTDDLLAPICHGHWWMLHCPT